MITAKILGIIEPAANLPDASGFFSFEFRHIILRDERQFTEESLYEIGTHSPKDLEALVPIAWSTVMFAVFDFLAQGASALSHSCFILTETIAHTTEAFVPIAYQMISLAVVLCHRSCS